MLDTDLEKFSITQGEIEKNKANLYDFLNTKRIAYFDKIFSEKKDQVEHAKKQNIKSMEFLGYLNENKIEEAKFFLLNNELK